MNGLILLLIALPMAVLAIDAERPGFVNLISDVLGGKEPRHGHTEISMDRRT